MQITVLTPDNKIFEGEVVSVKVPGTMGQFQILKNHAPIVSSLEAGNVEIVTAIGTHQYYDTESGTIQTANEAGRKINYSITGGFVEVLNNKISLLIQSINR
jgi:F-type H+-transporting ATPase subunit epsilon